MKTRLSQAFFALSLVVSLMVRAQTPMPKGYAVGDPVAGFQVRNVDNKFITLADYRSQNGLIVVFMANHCPFSKAYEERLTAIHNRFAAQGYPVLAIQTSDPAIYPEDAYEVVQTRARERSFAFAYSLDEDQSVAKAFGATRTPQAFLLKRFGDRFLVQYVGAIDDNPQDAAGVQKRYLEDALTALIGGRSAVPNTTRPIGCAIKWK